MATITKLKSGNWRVQVRRKGRYVSETFVRREEARRWALDAESQIDRGETPIELPPGPAQDLRQLVDLHTEDMCEVGKEPGPSKQATLNMLKRELGKLGMTEIDRDCIVTFGRKRAKQGAGPATVSMTSARSSSSWPTPRPCMDCRPPWSRSTSGVSPSSASA